MTNNIRIEISKQLNSRGELIKHLIIDDIIWMSNDDPEYEDIDRALSSASGICFIGGLGMGLMAQECSKKKEVSKVIVVEINQNIIDLVCPRLGLEQYNNNVYLGNKIEVYRGNAIKYFGPVSKTKISSKIYDYAYFDIWLEPDKQAKELMETCFRNIKPYMKQDSILEAWLKPRLEKNQLWE